MSAINKIAKESSINFSGSLLGNVLSYGWLMILTRYLSQEDLGNFTLAQSIVNISLIFVLLGLHSALDRFIPFFNTAGKPGKVKSLLRLIFRYAAVSSLAAGLLLFWSADLICGFVFRSPGLAQLLRIILFSIPFLASIHIVIYAFIGYKELRYNVYLKQLLEPSLRIVIASLVAIMGLGVLEWSYLYLATVFLTALAGLWLLYRNILRPLQNTPREAIDIREVLAYSWPISIASILIILVGQIDYLIIGIYHPSADVGVYRIYIQIAVLLKLILGSTARIYKPVISEMIPGGEINAVRDTYRRVSKWVLALTLLGFLVIALYGDFLTGLLFTEAYAVNPLALTILVLGILLNASFGPDGVTLEAFGSTRLIMINSLFSLLINIGLGFWLIPIYGILGAAIATAVTLVIGGLAGLLEILILYRMQPFTVFSLKIIAVGLTVGSGFALLNTWIQSDRLIQVIPMIILLVLTYGLGLYLTRNLDEEDRKLLLQVRNRIRPGKRIK